MRKVLSALLLAAFTCVSLGSFAAAPAAVPAQAPAADTTKSDAKPMKKAKKVKRAKKAKPAGDAAPAAK